MSLELLNKLNLRTMSLEMRGTGKAALSWEDVSAALAGLPKSAYDFALAIYKADNISASALKAWLTDWITNYLVIHNIHSKAANLAESLAFITIYQYIIKSRTCKQCHGLGVISVKCKLVDCELCNGRGYHGASTEDKLMLGKLDISRQCYERKYKQIELLATSELLNLDNIVIDHVISHLFGQNNFDECA